MRRHVYPLLLVRSIAPFGRLRTIEADAPKDAASGVFTVSGLRFVGASGEAVLPAGGPQGTPAKTGAAGR